MILNSPGKIQPPSPLHPLTPQVQTIKPPWPQGRTDCLYRGYRPSCGSKPWDRRGGDVQNVQKVGDKQRFIQKNGKGKHKKHCWKQNYRNNINNTISGEFWKKEGNKKNCWKREIWWSWSEKHFERNHYKKFIIEKLSFILLYLQSTYYSVCFFELKCLKFYIYSSE